MSKEGESGRSHCPSAACEAPAPERRFQALERQRASPNPGRVLDALVCFGQISVLFKPTFLVRGPILKKLINFSEGA